MVDFNAGTGAYYSIRESNGEAVGIAQTIVTK
jgi:hypothetical protein